MKTDRGAPVLRLLTAPEAARRLDLAPEELERLVKSGALPVVNVSVRGGRRFWSAEVEAIAASRTLGAVVGPDNAAGVAQVIDEPARIDPPVETTAPRVEPSGRQAAQRRAVARLKAAHVPRWPPYAFAPERQRTVYLAFRDPEHVTGYLEARKALPTGS